MGTAALLTLVLAQAGCRRNAGRRAHHAPPRGAVVVVGPGGQPDAAASALANELDGRLGGVCPRRVVGPGAEPSPGSRSHARTLRAVATACVDAGLGRAGMPPSRAEPWRTALIELAAEPPDDPQAGARRAIAREIVARGGGGRTLGLVRESAGAEPDPRATEAVAFGFLEALAARPGVGLAGALRFTIAAGRHGADAALAPHQLDAETLLSIGRAGLLERPGGSGPKLDAVRWEGPAGQLVARFDRPLLAVPVAGRACGVEVRAQTTALAEELAFPLDRTLLARCELVDGATVATLSIGEAPWSAPASAADGALAKPAHARVELP